jgi:hypothetical protein
MVVCIVPVCPVRKDASHRSEMTSQLLFGELAEVLDTTTDFSHIRCMHDGYEGWCQSSQLVSMGEPQNAWFKRLVQDWNTTIELNGKPMHIPLGGSLGMLHDGQAQIGPYHIAYNGKVWDPSGVHFDAVKMVTLAMQYLNTPYLWGGRSVFGIDCSGFVQQLYRFFNIALPRDAYHQVEKGEVVGFLQEAQPCDLAYFDNAEGRITHVGLLLGPDTIIHSSGKVRIDSIDTQGIINSDTGERTHKLRIIKRIQSR